MGKELGDKIGGQGEVEFASKCGEKKWQGSSGGGVEGWEKEKSLVQEKCVHPKLRA